MVTVPSDTIRCLRAAGPIANVQRLLSTWYCVMITQR